MKLDNQIICGDAFESLRQFPSQSVDCVVTSPPYFGLRDYGVARQIGLESSIQEYLDRLSQIFDEVYRVLVPQGTCWVNLGDTYGGDSPVRSRSGDQFSGHSRFIGRRRSAGAYKRKCLAQIPSRFALEMTERDWILRNEIIWWKPNCMPASVRDRFTVDYEKIFFFVKQRFYYFEQQLEPLQNPERLTRRASSSANDRRKYSYGNPYISSLNPRTAEASRRRILARGGRNRRCIWRVATSGYKGAHHAVYPPELIETPIKAGCPPGGLVLDPFMGAGTTAVVAKKLGRSYVGIELNRANVKLAKERLADVDPGSDDGYIAGGTNSR